LGSDIELIVKAIESLQTNVIKDYILPVSTVLISGGLGVGSAYYAVDKQEKNRIEIEKIKVVNNTLLTAMDVRISLISIKENYVNGITNHPIERILSVPPIMISNSKVQIELASLTFIVPKDDKTVPTKWDNIGYISTIFSNYNSLLDIWDKRNNIITDLLPKIKEHFGQPINLATLRHLIGDAAISQLSDLTEHALHHTDDLLIEISAFLLGFSALAKTKIDKKVAKRFGEVMEASLPTYEEFPKAVDIISKIPEVNYTLLSQLYGRSEDVLRDRYRPIY